MHSNAGMREFRGKEVLLSLTMGIVGQFVVALAAAKSAKAPTLKSVLGAPTATQSPEVGRLDLGS